MSPGPHIGKASGRTRSVSGANAARRSPCSGFESPAFRTTARQHGGASRRPATATVSKTGGALGRVWVRSPPPPLSPVGPGGRRCPILVRGGRGFDSRTGYAASCVRRAQWTKWKSHRTFNPGTAGSSPVCAADEWELPAPLSMSPGATYGGVEQPGVLVGLISRRSLVRIQPSPRNGTDGVSSNRQDTALLRQPREFESPHASSQTSGGGGGSGAVVCRNHPPERHPRSRPGGSTNRAPPGIGLAPRHGCVTRPFLLHELGIGEPTRL